MKIPKDRYIFFLIAVLISISISGFAWSLFSHDIILYGDATSHLNIARRIIDNKNPGFGQLGSSWLPLFHILLIPFVANDFLYRTGIAGYSVNSLLFILTGLVFYKILFYLFPAKKLIILMLTLLFSLNANLIYFQTTAMGETLLILTSLSGTYYLLKYIDNTRSTANLALAAFFVFLSSLNRYEGWFLACSETAFIFLYIFFKDKNYKRAEGKTILFGVLAFLGIVTWLLYNLAIFHDPLNFLHDTYTAAGQQKVLYAKGLLQTKYNLTRSIATFAFAIQDVSGIIFSILALISFVWVFVRGRKLQYSPIILFFSSIFFFEVLTLFLGITAIYVEQFPPFRLFNVRYALFIYPGLFLLISCFILSQKNRAFMYILLALLLIQNILLVYPGKPVTLIEGKELFGTDIGMVEAGNYLHSHYKGGNILASSGAIDPLFLFSDIPMKEFIYEGNRDLWLKSLISPQRYAKWIVITTASNPLDFVAKNVEKKPELLHYYRFVIKERNITIYERNK